MFQPLSRRTFLRGVGVTMALPWLESTRYGAMCVVSNRRPNRRFDLRCCFREMATTAGMVGQGEGKSMELGKVLEPMLPHREKNALPSRLVQRRGV